MIWAQLFMSGSEAGSSESISRTWPTASCLMASRVFTMGIGQNNPRQSRVRSTVTFVLVTDTRHGTPPGDRVSRRVAGGKISLDSPLGRDETMAHYAE